MSRKKILALAGLVVVLTMAFIGGYAYCANHPFIQFGRAKPVGETDFYVSYPTYVYGTYFDVPLSGDIAAGLDEFHDWADRSLSHIIETYAAPTKIAAYAEVRDGRTRFWYEGTVTTKDGETVPYFEEKVFDWVLVPDEALSDLKTSPF